jgi:integrase
VLIVISEVAVMAGKQAKILSDATVADLLTFAECTRNPIRNRVIILLSAKAGMRAGEIAGLTWDMVVNAAGQISNVIELRDHAAKKGSGRLIPAHTNLPQGTKIHPRHAVISPRSARGNSVIRQYVCRSMPARGH